MRDIYDIITLVNVPTDVATVLKNKHLFYRMCFRLNVRDGQQSQNSSRIVQRSADALSVPAQTFCQDRFMQHFSHADHLTFCQDRPTGGHEWLWAVMDDQGWSRVVTGNAWALLNNT